MIFTKRSKIRELVDLPDITELMKSYTGQEISPAMLTLAAAMSLQTAARSLGWSDEMLDAMILKLNAKYGQ